MAHLTMIAIDGKTRLKVFNETHWYDVKNKDEWILYKVTDGFFNGFSVDNDTSTGHVRPCKYRGVPN